MDELSNPDTDNEGLLRNRLNYGVSWTNEYWGAGVDAEYFGPHVLPLIEQNDQGSCVG